ATVARLGGRIGRIPCPTRAGRLSHPGGLLFRAGNQQEIEQMAAITTSPGYGTATWPATSRRAPSGAIPRVSRRVAPTTYRRRRLALATSAAACVVVAA